MGRPLERSHLVARGGGGGRLLGRRRRVLWPLLAFVVALGGPIAVTAAEPWLDAIIPRETLGLSVPLYMIAVAGAAIVGRLWGGVLAAVASFIGQLYAFTPPRGELSAFDVDDLTVLGVFLVVAIGIAQLISRLQTLRRFAQVSTERTAFLADATEALSGSLGFHEALTRLADLAVPRLGDLCIVDLLEDGLIDTVVVSNSERVDEALADNLLHQPSLRAIPSVDAPTADPATVIATGEPVLLERVGDEHLEAMARDARHRTLLRGLRIRSMMIIPVPVKEGTIGAVTFAFTRGRRRYAPIDVTLATDLMRRAGTVLETVRVYEERSRAARTLQQALLPPEIPPMEGVELVTRFQPASDIDLVGGDFYDVFEVDDGTWAIVVGDVCGKGMDAAALTGLARHTIRAAALRRTSPSRILRTLNDGILRSGNQAEERFCTAVVALLEAATGRLTISVGGHPLPLLRTSRTGEVRAVGRLGTLLGLFPDPELEDVTIELHQGDTLLLYTDGALDERAAIPEGRIADALARWGNQEARVVADEVDRARPEDVPRDDAALVVLRMGVRQSSARVEGQVAWSSS